MIHGNIITRRNEIHIKVKGENRHMKIQRVERHNICRGHPMWNACDLLCFQAKNYYNLCNYTIREEFFKSKTVMKYGDLNKLLKTSNAFKELGSNSAQMVTKMLCKNWKSFLVAIKDYSKNPNKYLGKPKIPKYLSKNGRYTCVLTNMQSQIHDGYLYFAFKRLKQFNNMFKTNIKGHHLCTRIVPKGNSYVLEIVHEQEINIQHEYNNHIASIDLGVNNLITLTNNIGIKPIIINGKKLKSYNQYYNKKKAELQSKAKKMNNLNWTKNLQRITDKRYWKIEYSMHKISKCIVDLCIKYDINDLVIGLNKTWKQESKLCKSSNQNFISIPYYKFISQLEYKLQNARFSNVI